MSKLYSVILLLYCSVSYSASRDQGAVLFDVEKKLIDHIARGGRLSDQDRVNFNYLYNQYKKTPAPKKWILDFGEYTYALIANNGARMPAGVAVSKQKPPLLPRPEPAIKPSVSVAPSAQAKAQNLLKKLEVSKGAGLAGVLTLDKARILGQKIGVPQEPVVIDALKKAYDEVIKELKSKNISLK